MTKEENTMMVKNLFQEAYSSYDSNQTWWIYAAFSNQLLLDEWMPNCDVENGAKDFSYLLLELRVFSLTAEYRLIRGNIGSDLKCRIRNEDSQLEEYVDYYDEWQYLDIDTNTVEKEEKKEEKEEKEETHRTVATIGGGEYSIPFSKEKLDKEDEKTGKRFMDVLGIQIRNYLSYYKETGQAYVSDWRILQLGGVE